MITEKKLAVAFTSFWREVTPLADKFMRAQNQSLASYAVPMTSRTEGRFRGLVNEFAFRLFCESVKRNLPIPTLSEDVRATLLDSSVEFIRRFRQSPRVDIADSGPHVVDEGIEISQRLATFFNGRHIRDVAVRPKFPGYALVDSCEGDVLAHGVLYEVKAAERAFRVVDLRQILTYCALNFASDSHDISDVALVNPRTGLYFQIEVVEFADELSGGSPANLFEDILGFMEMAATDKQRDTTG